MNLKDVLVEQGIYKYIMNIKSEKLREDILNECKITKYEMGDTLYFSPEEEQRALVFLDGKTNLRIYVNDSADYTIPWKKDLWFGLLEALGVNQRECEINFLEDTRVLSFPLKKILHSEPKENIELWMKVSKIAATKFANRVIKNAKRTTLSTEDYFLNALAENGYRYVNVSLEELSYDLDIQTRTLQRVVRKFEDLGLIRREKEKRNIFAVSKDRIDCYMSH